ncbi:hypothetical protein [Streptomyces sp. SID12501]|uniref:hypothetical protein n=1 Tax=Streptomyces sp. SID12501 TaxID=2706042 RepID=UPI001EF3C8B5|nr:hypothetical protein [Streptomyces sp. SID12501]
MGEPDRGRRPWRDRRAIAALLAGTAGLTVLGAVLVVLPGVVVDHDLAGASVAAQDRLKAVNDVRATLLQAVGGMVVLFGAYATWRQLRVSQDDLRATQEGYVTDRFSTAVDQLGSDKPETRIGGLHALWRIAEHSALDREAVISIQAAYLRTHLPRPPTGTEGPTTDVPINDVVPLEVRAADAQVALTGLGVLLLQPRGTWLKRSVRRPNNRPVSNGSSGNGCGYGRSTAKYSLAGRGREPIRRRSAKVRRDGGAGPGVVGAAVADGGRGADGPSSPQSGAA